MEVMSAEEQKKLTMLRANSMLQETISLPRLQMSQKRQPLPPKIPGLKLNDVVRHNSMPKLQTAVT